MEATTDREAEVRRYAVDALEWWMWDSWWCEWWDGVTVLATFTHALNDTDANVRQTAIHGLGRMDSEESAHQLIELLSHTDANMRLSSIHALAERYELSAVPALERLLSDEAEVTRVNIGTLYHAQKVSTEAADAIRSIQRHHQNNQ